MRQPTGVTQHKQRQKAVCQIVHNVIQPSAIHFGESPLHRKLARQCAIRAVDDGRQQKPEKGIRISFRRNGDSGPQSAHHAQGSIEVDQNALPLGAVPLPLGSMRVIIRHQAFLTQAVRQTQVGLETLITFLGHLPTDRT